MLISLGHTVPDSHAGSDFWSPGDQRPPCSHPPMLSPLRQVGGKAQMQSQCAKASASKIPNLTATSRTHTPLPSKVTVVLGVASRSVAERRDG